MSQQHVGRHRSPGFNPLSEIASIATESAKPAARASAIAVASTGLVASFSLPAQASGSDLVKAPAAGTSVSVALAVAAPSIADGVDYGEVAFKATKAKAKKVKAVKIELVDVPEPEVATPTTGGTTGTTSTSTSRGSTRSAAPSRAVPPATAGIIGIAASLMGIPYRYGGTTTAGFDCSGFTGYVYRRAGVSIPRTAEQQRQASTRVSNPAPGDLVFFGIPANHVGIYAGGGKIYDSGSSGGVTSLRGIWSSNVTYGRF